MANASAIIADMQVMVGDTAGNLLTTANGLLWLDQAQNQICYRLLALDQTKGFVAVANTDSFALPSDHIMSDVCYNSRNLRQLLRRISTGEYELMKTRTPDATGTPAYWAFRQNRVYIWPRYAASSLTTTVNASTTAAAATITMASTGNLRTSGRVIIDSEEVEYVGKTSTTITNVLRGQGGTTAATHVSAATVTQVDFELVYYRQPVALASNTAPEIPAAYQDTMKLWVQYLYYVAEGSMDKAAAMKQEWDKQIKDFEYNVEREDGNPLTVKDIDSQRLTTMWGPTP